MNQTQRTPPFSTILLAVCFAAVPAYATGDFHMPIADAFKISGRGVVVTGQIASGSVRNGDEVCLTTARTGSRSVTVLGIEHFNKLLEEAHEGDAVGVLIGEVSKDDITTGATDYLSGDCD